MSSEAAARALEQADDCVRRHDFDGVVAHLSTAVRGFTAAGDPCRAAMACARLGEAFMYMLGNLTAGRAWFTRARRLIADQPPCLEQGWVAIAPLGCDVDDPDELLAAAELALERARRFGDVNLETKALADAGLAHVQAGRVAHGMALLDEAMALACGPADDPDAAGKSVCSFFTACYFAADFDRAGTWTATLRQQGLMGPEPGNPAFLSSHCESVRAALLVELGRWSNAEALLQRTAEQFEALMLTPSWHPTIILADLRIRQGRLAEAEALLVGRDQALEALLPAARLHLARGEHDLAAAAARRGLRAAGSDRLRAVDLLTVLVDAELARGDAAAAEEACAALDHRVGGLDAPALQARAAAASARAKMAAGDATRAVALLEEATDRLDATRTPWLLGTLLVELARLREEAGDRAGAVIDAKAAASILGDLDVIVEPAASRLLERLSRGDRPPGGRPVPVASLASAGRVWSVSVDGVTVRLGATKGLRYLAELLAAPGVERHALDLVDRVEGPGDGGAPDRRRLGDAGELLDSAARAAYRRRIEALRAQADDELAAGLLDAAEATQAELDQLVGQLAAAFGLGGRARRAGSAAERARINVTRALRGAIARLAEQLPEAAAVLDRRVRTGTYCAYEPSDDDPVRWVFNGG